MNEFEDLKNVYYQKPPVFDAIAKALNPRSNFTKALYGSGQKITTRGIFSPGTHAITKQAQAMRGEQGGMTLGKLHALRGLVIGGNIVTAGLINIAFAVHNAVQNQKRAQRNVLSLKLQPEINKLAGDYGLDKHKDELLAMVLHRFGLGPAPSFWHQGKRLARKHNGPQSVEEGRAILFYRGYIQFERHLAQVLARALYTGGGN